MSDNKIDDFYQKTADWESLIEDMKIASDDSSEEYSSMFTPAKTSTFHDFLTPKKASVKIANPHEDFAEEAGPFIERHPTLDANDTPKLPKPGTPEWDELKNAIWGFQKKLAPALGGDEAKRILEKYGLTWDPATNRPIKGMFKESKPNNYDAEMSQEKPGAVCSECGRTVTEGEYSYGQSKCCDAEVTAEEFF